MDREAICHPGFEAVASLATKLIEAAGGGAIGVYLNGDCVLDLWAGHRDPETGALWESDTMAMCWSTTKGIASTVLHMLSDRRQLDYDSPIASYWPEFAANGKQDITVRQFMAMEAGLYDVRSLVSDPEQMLNHEVMASLLAAAPPAHQPGQANAYHAFTYGWIVAELVRSVTGETLGKFVQKEIVEPLGLDGCYIGTPASELGRVAAPAELKPETAVARRIAKLADPISRLVGFSPKRFAAAFLPRSGHKVIPTDRFLAAEVPGVNGVFTARSLARFYAALVSHDGLDGVQLWSPKTRRKATRQQNDRRDLIVPIRVGWRLGYHQPFPKKHSSPEAFGFYGAYGSGGFADPEHGLAVGLVVQEAKGVPMKKLLPAIYRSL
ncbi:MAG: serine hydrolase domain-containing protein [Acidimicrobiales bacterium]